MERRRNGLRHALTFAAIALLGACSPPPEDAGSAEAADPEPPPPDARADGTSGTGQVPPRNPLRNAYFGDLHVHTHLSFDAYLFGTRRTPDDAYEFAKGGAIEHASGLRMQMKKPLDFLGVTDHAFLLGMMRNIGEDPDSPYADHAVAPAVRGATDAAGSGAAFQAVLGYLMPLARSGAPVDLDDRDIMRSAWQEVIEAAERHNDPGRFTAFIGYEYTSSGPESQNLHRNVIFRGSQVPDTPFSRFDSLNPEDLWAWMDEQRASGREAVAIPHNSNGSDGWMFQTTNFAGDPIDAANAEIRMRNEPLVENTQVKGTSDTHPLLSPNDEWADFEIMPIRVASTLPSRPQGSYVREAYLNGLLMEQEDGVNPYRFGVIGSSDTHNAAGSFEEDNYWSKTGMTDIEPWQRGSVPLPDSPPDDPQFEGSSSSEYWGASGLAGVWAESNTRDDIFDAFRRKETFATSGPHIQVRFFAGYGLDAGVVDAPDAIGRAYAGGVPMGADLTTQGSGSPRFFLWASRDPDSAPLQRVQIIKGWIEDGEAREAVIDVACSDGVVDPQTGRCPDNGAGVDLATCARTGDGGASEIASVWRDPEFDPNQRAFYYVRVLENPKCRWSTWDAVRAGTPPNPDMHATIQDRAWSSPIWLRAGGG